MDPTLVVDSYALANTGPMSNMSTDELDMRNQDLEAQIEEYRAQLALTRRMINERDDLLIQLQWDEEDQMIDYEAKKRRLQRRNKAKVQSQDKQKIRRLIFQKRLMLHALNERDSVIERLEHEINEEWTMFQKEVAELTPPEEKEKEKHSLRSSFSSWGLSSSKKSFSRPPLVKPMSPPRPKPTLDSDEEEILEKMVTLDLKYEKPSLSQSVTFAPKVEEIKYDKEKKPVFHTAKRPSTIKQSHISIKEANWN
ncbi:hypothetical protein SAMD00019534_046750 [Acytostelium subglobosum LB1]|uniref:hypothetical protein n=1 Tax=Acytostelium subglobosum LB1 TaxID=1410327 RepID=UPI00064485C6|nr:hypothetical protein SAMD00019534_046750 [Acytostelium subglobosum LB1]GAM21500.1 hypothetical protein SAMD00019534_046750 [Acytostelium subglobosum LB1]|eukprot:XP_012755619.1 hypothetical protein SAMD00019534_046750 [Acytostelium subglobosum LB1]